MAAEDTAAATPRWGREGRPVKSRAILGTLREVLGAEPSGPALLDLGCGNGEIAAEFARELPQVTGVDPEPWPGWPALAAAHPGLAYLPGSYRGLAARLGPASQDLVVCNQVYEHVDDPAALLREVQALLRPGGACYFAGPNLLWPVEPHVHLPFVHWLPRGLAVWLISRVDPARGRELDAWSLDLWRLRRRVRAAGLEMRPAIAARARAGLAAGEGGLALRIAARLPGWAERLLLPLAPGFVFVLRKPGP